MYSEQRHSDPKGPDFGTIRSWAALSTTRTVFEAPVFGRAGAGPPSQLKLWARRAYHEPPARRHPG